MGILLKAYCIKRLQTLSFSNIVNFSHILCIFGFFVPTWYWTLSPTFFVLLQKFNAISLLSSQSWKSSYDTFFIVLNIWNLYFLRFQQLQQNPPCYQQQRKVFISNTCVSFVPQNGVRYIEVSVVMHDHTGEVSLYL